MENARLRKIQNWRMQLVITTNPYAKDPKQLFKLLDDQERSATRMGETKFDADGFELLKSKLSQSSNFVVKP